MGSLAREYTNEGLSNSEGHAPWLAMASVLHEFVSGGPSVHADRTIKCISEAPLYPKTALSNGIVTEASQCCISVGVYVAGHPHKPQLDPTYL